MDDLWGGRNWNSQRILFVFVTEAQVFGPSPAASQDANQREAGLGSGVQNGMWPSYVATLSLQQASALHLAPQWWSWASCTGLPKFDVFTLSRTLCYLAHRWLADASDFSLEWSKAEITRETPWSRACRLLFPTPTLSLALGPWNLRNSPVKAQVSHLKQGWNLGHDASVACEGSKSRLQQRYPAMFTC